MLQNKMRYTLCSLMTAVLVGCGGGDGNGSDGRSDNSDEYVPPNVPQETVSPELSEDFVPFERADLADSIRELFTGQTSNDVNYNKALGQMIGEVFGDYPYGRTGRLIQIYNMGVKSIQYPNLLCSSVNDGVGTKTLTLKSKNCVILDKTFRNNSKITQITNGNSTTLEFTDVRYGSNVDFNLKDEYLISGRIEKIETEQNGITTTQFKIKNLEFQRVEANGLGATGDLFDAKSKEYLQAKDYEYTLTSTPQSRTLSTSGTIIGQPLNAQYRYKFTYSTGETPFVMLPLTENSKLYQHLPSQGELVITDHYTQSNVIRVLPSKVDRLKASVLFNDVPVGDLLWSTVIGDK